MRLSWDNTSAWVFSRGSDLPNQPPDLRSIVVPKTELNATI